MAWWNAIFGSGKSGDGGKKPASHQLPSNVVAKELGEVNIAKVGDQVQVTFTILMEPTGTEAEGWQTGIALDASGSMEGVYGKGLDKGPNGSPPQQLIQQYLNRRWMEFIQHQGQQIPILHDQAKADLVAKGHFVWSKNVIEPIARQMTAYLAANLDADGGTTAIYWACGDDGRGIEVVGDLTAEDCGHAPFAGPKNTSLGGATMLTPAVKYFADRFADAKNGIYLFLTDGELNDLPEVKRYTIQLCKEIQAGKRNPLKCVLIGLGDNINEEQMEELDDLDSGTEVDVWDHKIAKEMRSLVEIFAEVVSENKMVASTGRIFDANGNVVKSYSDGLPGKCSFTMPKSSAYFELEVEGQRIRQPIA